ncbi:hypothetical protein SMACR_05854 [Sordaria macrospora]|uniref:WGS project CABT00000000 data, contig 2.24 n=2 Tax=Sordaria macrospora TaxID=5147 RepID=F7W3B4_SORMK|nr:uncharacterized protein SMAC_05854 [Sordaria macrospora k-hell]KAA8629480.1 hypothetical protein SMACR_05854 [Sordaria macrospora]WPJ65320.1 hypothetical protein SMAC4_05854 [Sordaria macrospora]CCC12116.1 unnamed protein product [Sordaria macrospora k-hell]
MGMGMADAVTPTTADREQEDVAATAAVAVAAEHTEPAVAELVPQNPPTPAAAAMESKGDNSASGAQPPAMRCCCGREDCVYLRHNCTLLKSVERDVHTAAKMGQTLLIRHEAYMAAAERDRAELTARIEQLERENAELEEKNREKIHENYSLHAELESLNDTVREADTRIDYLETTLRESQREIRRLEMAAERAATLEKQLTMLEEEQATLQSTLVNTQEEARTAITRWKQAEKGINDLQEQLERMEKEAKEERDRHAEVMGRIEKQREMEKELSTAAGRLKGAAAVKSLSETKSSRNVVSHFVRDLLQDNANLQLGIAELRDMLMTSHDEIQLLREQMQYHQPLSSSSKQPGTVSTLQTEFDDPDSAKTPKISQAVHVHHHYHIAQQKGDSRKSRKNRKSITSGTFSPPHIISAPTTPVSSQNPQWQAGRGLGPPFVPRHSTHDSTSTAAGRWSLISEMPSEFAPSSAPTSPQSNPRRNSVFDRGIVEVSVPNSPTTSVDPASPEWNRRSHRRQASQWSSRSTAMNNCGACSPPYPGHRSLAGLVLAEELNNAMGAYTTDDVPDMTHGISSAEDDTVETISANGDGDDPAVAGDDTIHHDLDFHPEVAEQERPGRLRRMTSHESIMSLSNGLDIHTLKVRPSQLTLRPLGLSAAGTGISNVTAMPTISYSSARGSRGSMHARDNLALVGQRLPRPVSTSQNSVAASSERPSFLNPNRRAHTDGLHMSSSSVRSTASRQLSLPALGKLVSWRPWGQSSSQPNNTNESAGTRSGLEPTPELPEPITPTLVGTSTGTGLGIAIAPSDGKSSYRSISSSTTTGTAGTAATSATTPLSSSVRSVSSATTGTTIKPRAPGINQPGVIPGFLVKKGGLPAKVTVDALDGSQLGSIEEAMREGI